MKKDSIGQYLNVLEHQLLDQLALLLTRGGGVFCEGKMVRELMIILGRCERL